MKAMIAILLASLATPALGQNMNHMDSMQHEGEMPEPAPMDHGAPPPDHSKMDYSKMDHSAMGHGASAAPKMAETPPPPEAGQGPSRAADAIWGAEAMRASREELKQTHGNMVASWFQADRLEYRARQGQDGYLWDAQAYVGGDLDKLWLKTEGEGEFHGAVEKAEMQALWSHAIAPFFDLQAGVRQDIAGPDRTHAVIGIQGLAPGMYEIDAAAFLSHKGDVTARVEVELDQRITQRLIVQPRAELNFAAQNIPELGVGAGVDSAEVGVRLRYQIIREFAPYIGIEQEWRVGKSASYARAAGDKSRSTNFVAGVRFWF